MRRGKEMAFENDPEGRRIAENYAGRDFDAPKMVTHTALHEYDGKWSLDEFRAMIDAAIASIPEQCRATAWVEMYDPGYDSNTSLQMHYTGPEADATVTDRVKRCVQYVAERRSSELETYNRLKAKFG
jgi:hypothetical protein